MKNPKIEFGSPEHIEALERGIKDVQRQIKEEEESIRALSSFAAPFGEAMLTLYVSKNMEHLENRKQLLKTLKEELKSALKKGG